MQPERIVETSLYADDLERAEAFYRDVLGLERIAREPERHVFFRVGEGVLLVFRAESTLRGQGLPGARSERSRSRRARDRGGGTGCLAVATGLKGSGHRARGDLAPRRPFALLPRPGRKLAGTGHARRLGPALRLVKSSGRGDPSTSPPLRLTPARPTPYHASTSSVFSRRFPRGSMRWPAATLRSRRSARL